MILNNREARLWTTALAFQGCDMSLSYLPGFVVKASSEQYPLPCFFLFFFTILGSFCGYSSGGSLALPCAGYSRLFGSSSVFRFVLMSFTCLLLSDTCVIKEHFRSFYVSHL